MPQPFVFLSGLVRVRGECFFALCVIVCLCASSESHGARMVTLAPHLGELVAAAGAESSLVGVSGFSDYPPSLKRLPVVSDASLLNTAAIMKLRPDVVLAWYAGTPQSHIDKLQRAGLRVVSLKTETMDDIPMVLRQIGVLAHTEKQANRAAADFTMGLQKLRTQYRDATPIRVFYQVWHQPVMTVNRQQIVSEALRTCGAVNVFADLPVVVPQVSRDAVWRARPQLVLGGGDRAAALALQAQWTLDGVALPVLTLPSDWLSRPTPRLLWATERLCVALAKMRV